MPAADSDTPLSRFIRDKKLDTKSQYHLLLALAPFLKAELFDKAIQAAIPGAGEYQHSVFLPTGETALFFTGRG